jgi:SMI1 / KNR4 family (SUKH-1)
MHMKHWVERIRELEWGNFDLREPASESQIAALEQLLGVPLPSDLAAFYKRTNGISGDNNGWEYQVIGNTEEVMGNVRSIRNGRKKLNLLEIIYPQVLKKWKVIPLSDGDNAVGMAAFYLTDMREAIDGQMSAPGIYRCFVSQPMQIRDPEFTFVAENLEQFAAVIFDSDQTAREGVNS